VNFVEEMVDNCSLKKKRNGWYREEYREERSRCLHHRCKDVGHIGAEAVQIYKAGEIHGEPHVLKQTTKDKRQ